MILDEILLKYGLEVLVGRLDDSGFVCEVLESYFEANGCPQDLDWVYSLYNSKIIVTGTTSGP